MEKELQETLGQVTMYSKMGRYISNKILKYNKSSSPTQHIAKVMAPPPYQYLKAQKNKDNDGSQHKISKGSFSLEKNRFGKDDTNKFYMTQPPVGYYKVNHSYTDKNSRQYNFDRSVPHFSRQNFFCNQSTPVLKNYPDLSVCKAAVHGFAELRRMTGRECEKASVRKFLEDPHQNRYVMVKDPRSVIDNPKSRINIKKNLGRGNEMFKSAQFTPDYNCNAQVIKRRLDTHGIPFEHQIQRDNEFLDAKRGISECFQSQIEYPPQENVEWKKVIGREKAGLLPSYMDKSIHTRMNLTQLNLKQLEMNCSKIKKKEVKNKGKKKKNRKIEEYIEEDWDKQN